MYQAWLFKQREKDAKKMLKASTYVLTRGVRIAIVCTDYPSPFVTTHHYANHMNPHVPMSLEEHFKLLTPTELAIFASDIVGYMTFNEGKKKTLPAFLAHVFQIYAPNGGGIGIRLGYKRHPVVVRFAEGDRRISLTAHNYLTLWSKSADRALIRTRLNTLDATTLHELPYAHIDLTDADERKKLPRYINKATSLDAAVAYVSAL
jgi:hypothetical protein